MILPVFRLCECCVLYLRNVIVVGNGIYNLSLSHTKKCKDDSKCYSLFQECWHKKISSILSKLYLCNMQLWFKNKFLSLIYLVPMFLRHWNCTLVVAIVCSFFLCVDKILLIQCNLVPMLWWYPVFSKVGNSVVVF